MSDDTEKLKAAIERTFMTSFQSILQRKIFLLLSTTIFISSMALEMTMISTIWVTVVSVRLVNCFRTSIESVFQDLRELFVRE